MDISGFLVDLSWGFSHLPRGFSRSSIGHYSRPTLGSNSGPDSMEGLGRVLAHPVRTTQFFYVSPFLSSADPSYVGSGGRR